MLLVPGEIANVYLERTIQTGIVELHTTSNFAFVELPSGAVIKVLKDEDQDRQFILQSPTRTKLVVQSGFLADWESMTTCPPNLSVVKRQEYDQSLRQVSTDQLSKTVTNMLSEMCTIIEQGQHRKRKKSQFPMKRWTEEEEAVLIDTYGKLVQNGQCRTADILEHLSTRLNRSTKAIDLRMQSLRKECKLLPLGADVDLYANGFAFPKTRKTKSEIAARNFMKRWTVEEDKILISFYNRCRANQLKFNNEVAKVAKILDRTDNSVCLRVIGLKKKYPKHFLPKQKKKNVSITSIDTFSSHDNTNSVHSFDLVGSETPISNSLFKSYAELMTTPVSPDASSRSNRKGTTWKKWTEDEEDVLVKAINEKPYTVSTSQVMHAVAKQLSRSVMATTLRLNHLRRKKPFLFRTKKLSRAHVKDEVFSVITDILSQLEGKPIGVKRPYPRIEFSPRNKRSRFEEEIDLSDYETWLNRQKEAVQYSQVFPFIPMSNWNKLGGLDTPTF